MLKHTVPGLTEERTIPLAEMLSNHGFVDVTGLTEYLFGIIPTRTVGKNMLAAHLNSYAIVGEKTSMLVSLLDSRFDCTQVFIIVVTEDSKVWVGKPTTQMITRVLNGGKLNLSEIDIRLTQFADRHDEPGFKRLVRPHRLRTLEVLSRSSPMFK